MVYFISQDYRCPECGYSCKWGPNDYHPAPVLTVTPVARHQPACAACWEKFIREHVPIMERVDE